MNNINRAFLILTNLIALIFLSQSAFPQDRICRMISQTNGIVWIEDQLDFGADLAAFDRSLAEVLLKMRQSETNLMQDIEVLLGPDPLSIQAIDTRFEKDRIHLKIRSKLVFSPDSSKAQLRWVSTFAGNILKFRKKTVGGTNQAGKIIIYENDGRPIICFPYLGDVNRKMVKTAHKFNETFASTPLAQQYPILSSVFSEDTEYECSFMAGGFTTELFNWRTVPKGMGIPSQSLLLEMEKEQAMSENDFRSLVSNIRIAKPGYYQLTTYPH